MDAEQNLHFIDIEASGFGRGSYPIEIGYVNQQNSFCSLIKPLPEWIHWDRNAEKTHGISRNILEEYGKPAKTICETLNEALYGITLYSDAWGNDSSWLWLLYSSCKMMPAFKLESIRNIIHEDQLYKWHSTKADILTKDNIKRHRASHDAFLLQQTYLQTMQT